MSIKKEYFDHAWQQINKCEHYTMNSIKEKLIKFCSDSIETSSEEFQVIIIGRLAEKLNESGVKKHSETSNKIKQLRLKKGL